MIFSTKILLYDMSSTAEHALVGHDKNGSYEARTVLLAVQTSQDLPWSHWRLPLAQVCKKHYDDRLPGMLASWVGS